MDEDVFLVDDDYDIGPPTRRRTNSMDPVIDLTAEDSETSDIEERNSLDLSSDDDLPPVNINASSYSNDINGTAGSARRFNFIDYGSSARNARALTPPQNDLVTDEVNHDAWPVIRDTDSENSDHVGWPPTTNGDLNINSETEDIGWPPATNSGSDINSEAEDIGWPPARESETEHVEEEDEPASQQSLVHYHPLSDSDQSDTEPPAVMKVAKKSSAAASKQVTSKAKEKKDSSPKRKRRTPEEIAEEAAHKDKMKKEKEAMRRLRPQNCQKHIVVEVDSTVPQIPALNAMLLCPPLSQLQHEVLDREVPYSVSWYRQVLTSEGKESKEYSDMMLQVLPMDMVESLVHKGDLCEHVTGLLDAFTNLRKVTFIVFDSSQYFKNIKKKKSGQISREQLEEAIAECQVERATTFRLLDTAQEIAEWIYRYSKSFAEHHFKVSKQGWQENFRFHLGGEKGESLKTGSAINNGMPQMWVRTLRKLRRATAEACEAVAAQYPSPTALIIAYEECKNEEEAKNLLQNVQMQRGAGPMAVSRRVGPVLSRKIHTLLTSTQPTTLLAETQ